VIRPPIVGYFSLLRLLLLVPSGPVTIGPGRLVRFSWAGSDILFAVGAGCVVAPLLPSNLSTIALTWSLRLLPRR
jgi:hypothetical protein